MASLVNINLQVVNRLGVPQANLASYLYNQATDSNPYHPVPTSVITSGTTGGDGRVLFTGITAGTYDIGVVTASGQNYMRNYVVKNEYVVPIGTTSYDFESRGYIGSSDTRPGAGVLTQNLVNQTGTITGTYSVSQSWALAFPTSGSDVFTNTGSYAKATGNSYYHSVASTPFTQRARVQVV